jgi:peptidyl-tRNA hydrolase
MKDFSSQDLVDQRKNQEDPIVVYIIVRESLGMSIGKTAAQCAHASQILLLKYFDIKEDQSKLERKIFNQESIIGTEDAKVFIALNNSLIYIFDEWLNSSFRKVVLKADDKEWDKIKNACPTNHVLVVDAGLTDIAPGSETVIGLWPMYKSKVPKVIKKLQVLK